MVGKQLDNLRLAVFRDAELVLRQVAGQVFLVVATVKYTETRSTWL